MKSDYITRAKKFIPTLDALLYNNRNIHYAINTFNKEHNRKVIFTHGLTRYVFITSDYVIKVDYSRDYTFGNCEDECEVYEMAKHDGMAYLFAEITKYEYYGHNYYIMPRIHGVGRTDNDAYDWMDAEELDWIQEHNIFDLHSLNYGWRDKHICLIDYSAHS